MPGLLTNRSSSSSSSSSHACKKTHLQLPLHHPDDVASHSNFLAPNRALPAFHTSASNMQLPACAPQPMIMCPKPPVADPPSCTRLCAGTSTLNYSSSGSPHDPSTACLAAMVHEFLEEEVTRVGSCGRTRCNCVDGVCSDEDACVADDPKQSEMPDLQLCEILEGITNCTSKSELMLLVDVARALEAEMDDLMGTTAPGHHVDRRGDVINTEVLRRPVMKRLRQAGYNAAICKSRWKHSDGLPAGDYEYIDVLMEGGNLAEGPKKVDRFIVDIDFRCQFEIARASQRYLKLLEVLPCLFVGRAERLKQIIKVMSSAVKRSLKEEGLLLPPWRKHRYMQAKWLSSYRRTTNVISSALAVTTTSPQYGGQEEFQLGFGFRVPKMMSVEVSKGMMDATSFRETATMAEAYVNRLCAAQKEQDGRMKTRIDVLQHLEDGDGDGVNNMKATDWKLPALDVKPSKATEHHIRISGLSTALKPRH